MKEEPIRAALYVRVSTDAQREEGYSIEAQKEALEGYCRARGFTQHEFYVDGGFSGSNLDRPEIQRLIQDARDKRFQKCIVYKLDRLSRSQKDTLYLIEDVLNPNGVDFISINETMDTSTPLGRLMLGILSAFAQLERENIKERTRMGMLERVKEGYWMGGGRVPFGYDYDGEKGILVPNQDAPTVRRMYEMYLEGKSPQVIADELGLKYDRLVMQVLRRRSNLGWIPYNGKEYRGRHQPLVDEDTFQRTMAAMEARSEKRSYKTRSLLAGLLVCGHCGARMHYQSWGNTGRKKISCYSRQTSKKYLVKDADCPQESLWQEDVEEAVLQDLFSYAIAAHEKTEQENQRDVQEGLQERLREADVRLRRLYGLYADSGDEVLRELIDQWKAKRDKLQKRLEEELRQKTISTGRRELLGEVTDLGQVWEVLTYDEKRRILKSLIGQIVITDHNVEIHYGF